jgi:thioredoxin reductase
MTTTTKHDVIIIGGSYAGLSAATQLARGRRSILMLDSGERRNRFATHAHGFLTRDGEPPADIARIGREQLLAYPTVTWRDARVTAARRVDDDTFEVTTADAVHRGRRIILAHGITDELPPVPGLSERWGKTVFHCPYCHGYELDRAPVAVLATNPMSHHQAMMLPDWGPTTFFTQGHTLEPDVRADLARRNVTIDPTTVVEARGERNIELVLADGRTHTFAGVFIATRTRPSTTLGEQLGCNHAESPVGIYIATDETKETSTRNVFACGDLALPMGSVAFAVADGARAGTGAHRSLMFR